MGPLGIYGINKTSLTISWHTPERNGGSPILDYSVEIQVEGDQWKHVATVTETVAKIEKLVTGAKYMFRIFARNEIGTSKPYESDEKITMGKTLCKYLYLCNYELSNLTLHSSVHIKICIVNNISFF